MKYFGIGNVNKYHIYILISFLCEFLISLLFGLNNSNKERPARIFPFYAKIKSHNILYNFIHLSAIFFGGVVLYIIDSSNKLKMKFDVTIEDYEKMKEKLIDNNGQSNTFNLILIGVLFSLFLFFQDFLSSIHNDISLWTIEILYIAVISYWIFKDKISRHKIVAIGIMALATIIDIIENFIPSTKHKNSANKSELTDKNFYETAIIKYGAYIIPLLILANEFKHILRDYCWVKGKYLMDTKSLPPYKIYITIGSIGIFFSFFFMTIFTFVPCKTFNNINKIGYNYFYNNTGEPLELNNKVCSLKDYDERTKTLYLFYDSIKIISKEYSNTDKDNMLEIFLLIPLFFIVDLVNEVSRLMMIRYIDPNIFLIYRYFYFFVFRIIQIAINKGDEQYMRFDKFALIELEQILACISGLIYIEFLELKFCGLDYELKKNIFRRGTKDFKESFDATGNDNESEDNDSSRN